MTRTHVEVRHGTYHDSVSLLQVSTRLAALPSVAAAQVAMATPLNLDVLSSMGFDLPPTAPDDLLVALRVEDGADDPDAVVASALVSLEEALTRKADRGSSAADDVPPRTTGAALRRDASPLVLVSVPGAHAAAEAWDALDAGSSVMLFSDNVAIEDEVALKTAAAARGSPRDGPGLRHRGGGRRRARVRQRGPAWPRVDRGGLGHRCPAPHGVARPGRHRSAPLPRPRRPRPRRSGRRTRRAIGTRRAGGGRRHRARGGRIETR